MTIELCHHKASAKTGAQTNVSIIQLAIGGHTSIDRRKVYSIRWLLGGAQLRHCGCAGGRQDRNCGQRLVG